MLRSDRGLVLVLLGSLACSSCTCQRQIPEPPPQFKQQRGFSAALPTAPPPRISEEVEVLSRVTPIQPTLPPTMETPTAAVVELPVDFPVDIPVFRGAKAFSVQQLAGNARNVLFHANSQLPEIFHYYRDNMRSHGWELSQEYLAKDQSFLSFRKGRQIANMTISNDPRTGRQIIGIMYQEEEPIDFPEF